MVATFYNSAVLWPGKVLHFVQFGYYPLYIVLNSTDFLEIEVWSMFLIFHISQSKVKKKIEWENCKNMSWQTGFANLSKGVKVCVNVHNQKQI